MDIFRNYLKLGSFVLVFFFFRIYSFCSTSSANIHIYEYMFRHRHACIRAYMHTHTYINTHTPSFQILQAQLHWLFLLVHLTDIQAAEHIQCIYTMYLYRWVYIPLQIFTQNIYENAYTHRGRVRKCCLLLTNRV